MNEVLRVLMQRDGLSVHEAKELIEEMKERVHNGEDPEEVLLDIGLEPDYLFDII